MGASDDGLGENAQFRFLADPGPHAVGLRVVEQYDGSRVFRHSGEALTTAISGERARPIQTLLWYPAGVGGGKAMTVADYGNLWATETSFGHPHLSHDAREWLADMTPALAQSLWAVRDAPPSAGAFPVVIYAPSFSAASWENADLCEYLASHGYLVIASPSMGATGRPMTSDVEGIEAQARDISFLIGYARSLPNADLSTVAVAGFSWGGLSNLFAAARDTRITALVALDGSLRYWSGLIKQAGYVQPQRLTLPLLYFAQGHFSLEDQDRYLKHNDGPNVLNAWTHGDLTTVSMLGLTHPEHSSMFQRNAAVWWKLENVYKQKGPDCGRQDGAIGYAWIARYTCQFLDVYSKHNSSPATFLEKTPRENGVPPHVMTVTHRAGEGDPATFDTFRKHLTREGFDHIEAIHAALWERAPDFRLDEEELRTWALDLLDASQGAEALALLKFSARIFPDSGSTHVNLGDAWERCGNRQQALNSYRRAIEKDPLNADALWKLSRLSGNS